MYNEHNRFADCHANCGRLIKSQWLLLLSARLTETSVMVSVLSAGPLVIVVATADVAAAAALGHQHVGLTAAEECLQLTTHNSRVRINSLAVGLSVSLSPSLTHSRARTSTLLRSSLALIIGYA